MHICGTETALLTAVTSKCAISDVELVETFGFGIKITQNPTSKVFADSHLAFHCTILSIKIHYSQSHPLQINYDNSLFM